MIFSRTFKGYVIAKLEDEKKERNCDFCGVFCGDIFFIWLGKNILDYGFILFNTNFFHIQFGKLDIFQLLGTVSPCDQTPVASENTNMTIPVP